MSGIAKKNEKASVENVKGITKDSGCSSPTVYKAIGLAVHNTNEKPSRLSAVLAPRNHFDEVARKWGFEGEIFQTRLRYEQEVFFCVPLNEKEHLRLPDNIVRLVGIPWPHDVLLRL